MPKPRPDRAASSRAGCSSVHACALGEPPRGGARTVDPARSSLSSPTGLADGLALKELRYADSRLGFGDSPRGRMAALGPPLSGASIRGSHGDSAVRDVLMRSAAS